MTKEQKQYFKNLDEFIEELKEEFPDNYKLILILDAAQDIKDAVSDLKRNRDD